MLIRNIQKQRLVKPYSKTIILSALILTVFSNTLFARLGESEAQIEERY